MHPLTTFRESAAGAAHSKRFAIKKITIIRQPWFAHHKVEVTVKNGSVVYKCSTGAIKANLSSRKTLQGIKKPRPRKPISKV